MKITTRIFLAFAVGSFSMGVHAACDQLRENIGVASELLNKTQQASRFDEARRGMKQAGSAIGTVADDARDCPCPDAANLFDDAAAKVRRASDADGVGRFNVFTKQGVEFYGAAIDALNACPEGLQQNTLDDAGVQQGDDMQDEGEAQNQ